MNKQVGTLSILNVSEGDIKITFNKEDDQEKIRASRIVKDALKRGYALLIEVDGAYQRAIDFDETVCEYIIADYEPNFSHYVTTEKQETPEIKIKKNRKTTTRRRVPMHTANAVGVAPSAGG